MQIIYWQTERKGSQTHKHPMLNEPFCSNPLRIARVEQLARLYAEREAAEISPFDDDSANLMRFLNLYDVRS